MSARVDAARGNHRMQGGRSGWRVRYHAGLAQRRRTDGYGQYMLIITIKQGKEKSLLAGEPWIYASAIERVDGKPAEKMKPGATAIVQSSSTRFLARAAYNAKSQIRARVWSFEQNEPVDHALIKRRIKAALARRASDQVAGDQTLTLVNAEADGLPGLLVERWGDYLICQFQAAGVDAWKVPIVQALMAETQCPNVYERCDELMRKGEGLGLTSGALAGSEPVGEVALMIDGARFSVNLKTGFRRPLR